VRSPLNAAFVLPRIYPIVDTGTMERFEFDPVECADALLNGGARILQFRHKGFWSREIFEKASEMAKLCGKASAIFVVNDRADYAALLDAGVHVGQEDLTPDDVRRVIGSRIVGYSTHNMEQMRRAADEPVDYVAFGPIFGTASKDRPDPTVGVEALREVRELTERPLVAIGGITMENAPLCFRAGADSVAVISGMLPTPCTPRGIRERMQQWVRAAG